MILYYIDKLGLLIAYNVFASLENIES